MSRREKVILLYVLLLAAIPVLAQTPTPSLKNVQRIYVGPMGQSDEAERFRILLRSKLSNVGFTIVDSDSKADGILSGILTVRVHAEGSSAQATVSLSSPDGVRLWEKDFEPGGFGFKFSLHGRDVVQLRAEDVAKNLRKDWKKR